MILFLITGLMSFFLSFFLFLWWKLMSFIGSFPSSKSNHPWSSTFSIFIFFPGPSGCFEFCTKLCWFVWIQNNPSHNSRDVILVTIQLSDIGRSKMYIRGWKIDIKQFLAWLCFYFIIDLEKLYLLTDIQYFNCLWSQHNIFK